MFSFLWLLKPQRQEPSWAPQEHFALGEQSAQVYIMWPGEKQPTTPECSWPRGTRVGCPVAGTCAKQNGGLVQFLPAVLASLGRQYPLS